MLLNAISRLSLTVVSMKVQLDLSSLQHCRSQQNSGRANIVFRKCICFTVLKPWMGFFMKFLNAPFKNKQTNNLSILSKTVTNKTF